MPMSAFRRRQSEPKAADDSQSESESSPSFDSTPPTPAPVRIPAHIERALITLTTKMQECVERLDTLEGRTNEINEAVMNAPSHSDVLEVRIHSAKLAAELARATVELRGEIGVAIDEARRVGRTSGAEVDSEADVHPPVDVRDTEPTVDLIEDESDSGSTTNGNGYSASA